MPKKTKNRLEKENLEEGEETGEGKEACNRVRNGIELKEPT